MIKFVDHDATSVPEITVVDVGVLQLKTAVDKLMLTTWLTADDFRSVIEGARAWHQPLQEASEFS